MGQVLIFEYPFFLVSDEFYHKRIRLRYAQTRHIQIQKHATESWTSALQVILSWRNKLDENEVDCQTVKHHLKFSVMFNYHFQIENIRMQLAPA